jgi:hypothetical protein
MFATLIYNLEDILFNAPESERRALEVLHLQEHFFYFRGATDINC